MALSERERRVCWIGGTAALAVVVFNWGLAPLWARWDDINGRLEPRMARLRSLESDAARWDAMVARRARLVAEMGCLCPWEPQAPAGEEAANDDESTREQPGEPAEDKRLEATLEELLKQNGAAVKTISLARPPADAPRGEHFAPVAFRVEADTQTDKLLAVLHALEKGGRYFRVHSLKLHHDGKHPNKLSVSMELLAYRPVR